MDGPLFPRHPARVPYDAEVAERVRAALAGRDVREVRMFGGLAFVVDDRMVVCASGTGLLVRVAPEDDATHLGKPCARRAEMGTGRSMGEGWIAVDASALADDFGYWVEAALTFHARGLRS